MSDSNNNSPVLATTPSIAASDANAVVGSSNPPKGHKIDVSSVSIHRRHDKPELFKPEQPKMRPRTFMERQPYIFAYGAAISTFSPVATAYQLCKLYHIKAAPSQLARMSATIFPHQTMLKALQMNASTPVKEYLNPWAAFAVVGVLQGGVYGQSNVHFSNALKLGKVASLKGVFRGSAFAGCRDTISQGIPFMCSGAFRKSVLDPLLGPTQEGTPMHSAKIWTSVISTSVVATYLSQGLHNFQIAMQADQSLGYVNAVQSVIRQHGAMSFIRGAEARVGLLLIVNILNEVLLKPAWTNVPVDE